MATRCRSPRPSEVVEDAALAAFSARLARHHGRGAPIVLAILGALVGCAGTPLPTPECVCSAAFEIVLAPAGDAPPETIRGAQFFLQGKRRTEFVDPATGVTMIWIDRPDLYVAWLLDTKTLTLEEHSWRGPARAPAPFPDPLGSARRATLDWQAREPVNGVEADRFALRSETAEGTLWLTPDRITVRFEGEAELDGVRRALRIDYSRIRRGPVASWLFGVPRYYGGWEERRRPRSATPSPPLDVSRHLRRLREEMSGRTGMP